MVVGFESRFLLLVGLGDGHLLTYHIHTSIAVSLVDIDHQVEQQKLGQAVDKSSFLELILSEKRKCVLGKELLIYIKPYIHTYIRVVSFVVAIFVTTTAQL